MRTSAVLSLVVMALVAKGVECGKKAEASDSDIEGAYEKCLADVVKTPAKLVEGYCTDAVKQTLKLGTSEFSSTVKKAIGLVNTEFECAIKDSGKLLQDIVGKITAKVSGLGSKITDLFKS